MLKSEMKALLLNNIISTDWYNYALVSPLRSTRKYSMTLMMGVCDYLQSSTWGM